MGAAFLLFDELLDLRVHDFLRVGQCGAALCAVVCNDVGQIIHGVNVGVVQLAHGCLDVARYAQIHHDHGAATACFDRRFDHTQTDDRQGAGGTGNDDVKACQLFGQFGQANRLCIGCRVRGEQGLRAFERAVGDGEAFRLRSDDVRGDDIHHFACADQKHVQAVKVFEDAFGQFDRSGGHGHGVLANGGVGAYVFGYGETFFEPETQLVAHGIGLECDASGLFHLPQNLRLAQHHGVHAAGDGERVIERGFALQNIHVLGQFTQGHIVVGRQPLQNRVFRAFVFMRMAQVHLHAVAGGQYGQLRRRLVILCVSGVVQAILQFRQRVVQLGRRKRDPLAQGQRSGGVI